MLLLKRPQAGEALLELMFGMALFAMVVAGILSLSAHALQALGKTIKAFKQESITSGCMEIALKSGLGLLACQADHTRHHIFGGP